MELKRDPQIIVATPGRLFDMISKKHIFTDNIKTYTICEFRSNTKTYLINKFDSSKKNIHIYNNIKKNKKEIFQNSDEAVLIYISYPRKNSRANSLTLISKYDFK